LEGVRVGDLLKSDGALFEVLANPSQLRWLSPYSGPAYMASGAVLNTLLDWAAKKINLPLWKALALEPSENLLRFCSYKQYSPFLKRGEVFKVLEDGLRNINVRIAELEKHGLPVYYTTWMHDDFDLIAEDIKKANKLKGINLFKLKIGSDLKKTVDKIDNLLLLLGNKNYKFCADSNQTLSYDNILEICNFLEHRNFLWLEEPFAPDNVRLHKALRRELTAIGNSLEIVTGENCPNAHTAIELIQDGGCSRYQIDACRQLSISDMLPILVAAKNAKVPVVPHAGGSGLDELTLHISGFNYSRIIPDEPLALSLLEHVGFCSWLYKYPANVINGRADMPNYSGYLGDVSARVYEALKQQGDIKWLEL